MKLRSLYRPLLIATTLIMASFSVSAAEAETTQILIRNVNVFDGKSEDLKMGVNVLIENNLITAVGADASAAPGAEIIDG